MAARDEKGAVEVASSAGARMIGRAQEGVVQVSRAGRGVGAGTVWRGEGGENLVLTNNHVVVAGGRRGRGRRGRGRRNEGLRVTSKDGRAFDAEILKRSRDLDLALLRVPGGPEDLPAVPVGDSGALRVGELVYAIGHPWGRPGAVTAGVVSGLGAAGGPAGRYVRSDVALAPGNSGGPLLNARGEVVGINAMIFGDLAISIPSNSALAWASGARGGRPRPRLGLGLVPAELPASSGRANGGGGPQTGLVVAAVEEGGPADRAGIIVGDVLVGAGGAPLRDVEALLGALARGGEAVELRVLRGGNAVRVEVGLESEGRAA